MKKSSLGRRSATGSSRMGSLGSDSLRKSGIPVKVQSGDRSMLSSVPISTFKTSKGPVAATPKTPQCYSQNLPSSTVRPYRSAISSTDSTRLSSLGGTKGTKKDTRLLHDKEWQMCAERRIYNYFYNEGTNMIPSTNIKQMSLNLFVDVVNYLFKKLDPSCEINKTNYKHELPFLLKKLQYMGKIDKSLLSTVNAPHSWPYALGILHFLLEAVECTTIDAENLLFPDCFNVNDNEDDDDGFQWDRKKRLVYFIKSYQIATSKAPDAPNQLERLEEEFIREHFPEDIFESLDHMQRENDLLAEEVNVLDNDNFKLKTDVASCEKMISTLSDDLRKGHEYILQQKGYIKNLEDKIKGLKMDIEDLEETLSKRKEKKEKLIEELSAQAVSENDMEQKKEKRHMLILEIEYEKQLLAEYTNLVYAEEMKITTLKKQFDSVMMEYTKIIADMMEVEPNIEKLKIDGSALNMNVDEVAASFEVVLKESKEKFEQLNHELEKEIKKTKESRTEVENEVCEKKKFVEEKKLQLEKLKNEVNKLSQEHETWIQNLQAELDSVLEKCKNLDDTYELESRSLSELKSTLSLGHKKLKEMTAEEKEIERQAVYYSEACSASILKHK